jgi:NADPH oxidase 2
MATKRSSGLDFSDRQGPLDALAAHPDVLARAPNATNLQRNKTERHRLQGLMRSISNARSNESSGNGSLPPSKMRDEKLMDKYHTWLINGGRSQLLFGAYVFLHMLVFAMGFMHYQLKDSNIGTRAIVGLGFRE